MSWKRRLKFDSRKQLAGLLASYLVLFTATCGLLLIAGINSPESIWGVLAVAGVTLGLSLLPILAGRSAPIEISRRSVGISFLEILARLFRKEKPKASRHRVWKRKRGSFIPQPHGSEYFSTFVPERDDAPAQSQS